MLNRLFLTHERFEHDATVARLVGSWPSRISSERAARLGLKADGDFRNVILQYVRDHPAAVTNARALGALEPSESKP